MIAGGSEAAITPMGVGGFGAMRALSTRNDAPANASRPFDRRSRRVRHRRGLGRRRFWRSWNTPARGARIYAELVGYGMSGDAYHITAQPEDGDGAVRSMQNALESAGVRPSRPIHQRPRHVDADQ